MKDAHLNQVQLVTCQKKKSSENEEKVTDKTQRGGCGEEARQSGKMRERRTRRAEGREQTARNEGKSKGEREVFKVRR